MAAANCPAMVAESSGPGASSPDRDGAAPLRTRRNEVGGVRIALILGVVALALGASGLAISLSNAGPTGATGPRGLAGPGAITSSNYDVAVTPLPYATCMHDNDSNFSFAVGGPGNVVVAATVTLKVHHTAGQTTSYYVGVENASRACVVDLDTYGQINDTLPTGLYYPDVSVTAEYTVGAPGTYIFAVAAEAINTSATDTTYIWGASEVGTFYPT